MSKQLRTSVPAQKKLRAKDHPLANDFVDNDEFDRLLDAWFGNIARVLVPGRHVIELAVRNPESAEAIVEIILPGILKSDLNVM